MADTSKTITKTESMKCIELRVEPRPGGAGDMRFYRLKAGSYESNPNLSTTIDQDMALYLAEHPHAEIRVTISVGGEGTN